MNIFKKRISAAVTILFVTAIVAALPAQVEAKKFDRSTLGLGKAAKARRSSSFLGGDPDRPIIIGSKGSRRSSSVSAKKRGTAFFIDASSIYGSDVKRTLSAKKHGIAGQAQGASRKFHILPYIEQDNLYK